MSPDPGRAPAVDEQPAPLAAGDVHADWCPVCKAWTVLAGMTLLLTAAGVSQVGTFSWCEVCDDPAFQADQGGRTDGR
ncbi:hypothetical protein [[Kitasatospora] papulosa]|uniref:hypothetical protein n=1 Tax=[Kitasatospora] papulosa TaxID=1464011 RepID=UPI003699DE11